MSSHTFYTEYYVSIFTVLPGSRKGRERPGRNGLQKHYTVNKIRARYNPETIKLFNKPVTQKLDGIGNSTTFNCNINP